MGDSSMSSTSSDASSESSFTILVASDIHLGYAEKDVLRGNDTYVAFEEVLQIARAKEVDFLLLGGDLFHENKPSSKSMTKCVQLLRKYCLGPREKPIEFNIVSDQSVNFNHSAFPVVNYQDENLKICLPVFSIHGNHDDPAGKDSICALDTLSAMGLVNFFGKYVNIEQIEVQPLLLEKGEHKIALYGLGAMPEERLHRMFLQDKVDFVPPDNPDRWFKIFVVHQNRVAHGTKYLPEGFLGHLPDLVIWGHEHEAQTDLSFNEEHSFHIYQPGSTVATSLCAAESAPKHVGLITIRYDPDEDSNHFRMEAIPLQTVRQLICEDISLDEILENRNDRDDDALNDLIKEYLCEKIQELINKAAVEHSGNPLEPAEPLIRVRAEYTKEYQHINPGLFAHHFLGKVANPKEIILFKQKRPRPVPGGRGNFAGGELDDLMDYNVAPRCNIDDVIYEYFKNTEEKNKLTLLSEKGMVQAVKEIVEKEQTTERLSQAIDFFRNKIHESIVEDNPVLSEDKSEIEGVIKEAKEKYLKNEANEMNELKALFQSATNGNGNSDPVSINDISDDDLDDNASTSHSPTSSQLASTSRGGRGRGRATRGAGRGRGRGKTQPGLGTLESVVKVSRRS